MNKSDASQTTSQIKNHKQLHKTPFSDYFNVLSDIDKGKRYSQEYGSIMILGLVEEVGEMARAYLAEHGRKKTNLTAQADESYEQELGDLLVTILRFARVKNINLHERIMYSLEKIKKRKIQPKTSREISSASAELQKIVMLTSVMKFIIKFTFFIVLVASVLLIGFSASQAQSTISLGILGDSTEDEYRADDNREGGTQYASNTLSWTELVVKTNRLNLGPWGTRAEPRRTGYEFNWSRTGAETNDIISSGALDEMVNHIQQGDVDIVFYTIGGNDFAYYRDAADIYSGALSGASLTFKLNSITSDMTESVNALLESDSNIPILVTTLADPGISPSNIASFPDATKRQRVTDAINVVNQHIIQLANSNPRITLLDIEMYQTEIMSRMNQNGKIVVGGEEIAFSSGSEPHHAIISDKIHAGTVMNALYANLVIDSINSVLNTSIARFSDQESLAVAGILTSITPSPSITPIATQTATPSATIEPTSIPNSCPSDINQDNATDVTDYSVMLLDYLQANLINSRSDVNQDSFVDISDYVIILQNFFKYCN